MKETIKHHLKFSALPLGIALSATITISPCFAAPPVNTTNDGQIVPSGTYYNTFDQQTTFTNSGTGGLWVKSGSLVRGLEVNETGQLTNNGGTLHFYAPGNVVRIDGSINVSGVLNGSGAYLGNGGKVFIDSAYLFHNGTIYANGINGGLIQASVSGMTIGVGSRTEAKGFGGAGGAVMLSSSGPVDLRRTSVIDTSGRVIGSLDTNVIDIEGSLINQEGTLKADGVATGSRGGTIRLIASGQSDLSQIKDILQSATQKLDNTNSSPTISPQERIFLLQRTDALIRNHDGSIYLAPKNGSYQGSVMTTNATRGPADPNNDYTQSAVPRAGDGGTIILSAMNEIQNHGRIQANGAIGQHASVSNPGPTPGGNGGTIALLAQGDIVNDGQIEANGARGGAGTMAANSKGGQGGLIALGYNGQMQNLGTIAANGAQGGDGPTPGHGGQGGLIVFSGNVNPTGNGIISANGGIGGNTNNLAFGGKAGTIVTPNPSVLGATQIATQLGYENGQAVLKPVTEQTQTHELLTQAENLIFMTRNGGSALAPVNLFDRLPLARMRSVIDPTGALGLAAQEITIKSQPDASYLYRNLILSSSRDNLTLDFTPPVTGIQFAPFANLKDFSELNSLTILNDGTARVGTSSSSSFWFLGNRPILSGRRLSVLANGDFINTTDLLVQNDGPTAGTLLVAAKNNVLLGTGSYGTLFSDSPFHGGSVILKAAQDIKIEGASQFDASIHAGGGVIGGNNFFQTGRDFLLGSGSFVMPVGGSQGGILSINSHNNLISDGHIVASGPLEKGGFVQLHADNTLLNTGSIDASGMNFGGSILLTAGDHIPDNNNRLGISSLPLTFPGFSITHLTPPVTTILLNAQGQLSESVFSLGYLTVQSGIEGCSNTGKIYLGGNNQVVLANNNRASGYNYASLDYNQVTQSPNPNQAFQDVFNLATVKGERIYAVVGQQLTNQAGQTRTASDVVNIEAGPNSSAPNVNPSQNGQGAELPQDFKL